MAFCEQSFFFQSVLWICISLTLIDGARSDLLTPADISVYRQRVVRMFEHAYGGYLAHAYPLDELRPLTCDGHDTWGSYSLTLIDALDTLAVMGNHSEFRRVAKLLLDTLDFDRDINVSVFETNIRVVGGLVSAHLLSYRTDFQLEPGWPCAGPLLRLAEKVARKLLPAFNTSTGMPYGTVNLLHGVPIDETSITCTAGVGTFIVEFGALSRLTGDTVFEDVAMRAVRSLHGTRSSIGLVGNHLDILTGKWTAQDSGIGAGVDSYFEYLVKGAMMFNYPELIEMFHDYKSALELYAKRDDWFLWAQMEKGSITQPVFQSLEAYWPGVLSLIGEVDDAMRTYLNYHQIWRQYGFMPEYYNIPHADATTGRESYPLRPEFIESTMYLYRATKDPYLLKAAVDVLESLEHSTKTSCGYATVRNVKDHTLENRMESFFLAETTKYLYLVFDPDNFIHNTGASGTVITRPEGECVIDAGGYVFNTEAHPVDIAALHCCSVDKTRHDAELSHLSSHVDILSAMDLGGDSWGTQPPGGDPWGGQQPRRDPRPTGMTGEGTVDNVGVTMRVAVESEPSLGKVECGGIEVGFEVNARRGGEGGVEDEGGGELLKSSGAEDSLLDADNDSTLDQDAASPNALLSAQLLSASPHSGTDDLTGQGSSAKETLLDHPPSIQNPGSKPALDQDSSSKPTLNLDSSRESASSPHSSYIHLSSRDRMRHPSTLPPPNTVTVPFKLQLPGSGGGTQQGVDSDGRTDEERYRERVKRRERLNRLMTCPARPFHARFALMGEVFLVKT